MNLKDYLKKFSKSFRALKKEFPKEFNEQVKKKNAEPSIKERIQKEPKLSSQQKKDIIDIIEKIEKKQFFKASDGEKLKIFFKHINRYALRLANMIPNFATEAEKNKIKINKKPIKIFELCNSLIHNKPKGEIVFPKYIKGHKDNLLSIFKHLQSPNDYPIKYPFYTNIIKDIFGSKASSYDDLCKFYQKEFPKKDRFINFQAWTHTIGDLVVDNLKSSGLEKKDYEKIGNALHTGYYRPKMKKIIELKFSHKKEFISFLKKEFKNKSSVHQYIKALDILSEVEKKAKGKCFHILEQKDVKYLEELQEEVQTERKRTDVKKSKFYNTNKTKNQFFTHGFFSASLTKYINFLNKEVLKNKSGGKNLKAELNTILYGPPGTGKTYHSILKAAQIIKKEPSLKNYDTARALFKEELNKKANNKIAFITFHQSYSYEDFIQGIRPDVKNNKNLQFEKKDGAFKIIAEEALKNYKKSKIPEESENYVVIIDEINRANISRVFGELITLIEPDKRFGSTNSIKAKLPSGDEFEIPRNLYIIGTMNTADKSIALLDIALRRRFSFEHMYPKYEIIQEETGKNLVNDSKILEKINEKIIKLKGDNGNDFQIGHSYFMPDERGEYSRKETMNKKVIPLLLEYFMNKKEAVKEIIEAAGLKIRKNSFPLEIE